MSNKRAGERIRDLREMHHYTRAVLAEKAEISEKFLYEIEAGRKGFSADTLCRIAKALSVSCDYIMLGEEKEHRGMEKTICVLEMVEPKQRSKMQDIVKILYDMCETL